MGGEEDDAITAEGREEIAEADALFRIEAGGGFIYDEEIGIVEEGLGDAEPTLHAARKFFDFLIFFVGEIDELDEVVNFFLTLFLDVGEDGEVV